MSSDVLRPDPPALGVERRGPALVLTMRRPAHRNALDADLVGLLGHAMTEAASDPTVRAVILTGGDGTFCPGLDLAELRDELLGRPLGTDERRVWELGRAGDQLLDRVYRCPLPTIAAVDGVAAGIGAGLASVCDLAVLSWDARIGYPEVRNGVQLTQIVVHLVRLVGERTARRLLLGGEMLTAGRALELGLVTDVVDGGSLGAALAWADRIAANSPDALAATRRALAAVGPTPGLLESADLAPWLTAESAAGVEAFFAKEDPPWSSIRREA